MLKFLFLVTTLSISLSSFSNTDLTAIQPKNAEVFCQVIMQANSKFSEKEYLQFFDPSFTAKIPFGQFSDVFLNLYANLGKCLNYSADTNGDPSRFVLTLSTEKKVDVSFTLKLNPKTALFTSLQLLSVNNRNINIQNWEDVGSALKNLDKTGKLAVTLKTSDSKIHLAHSESEVFAIGSTFKLYVLGALQKAIANGKHTWSEKLAIRDSWKSLPSGMMQDLPAGDQFSLFDFALNMISISDNTATDHLLNFLGRETIEAMLKPMKNRNEKLNIPFLSTVEMFKLKWAIDPKLTAKYISSDVALKRKMLEDLSQVDRKLIGTNGKSYDQPTAIGQLEWFGTTDDTCNAILYLADQKSLEIRDILSKNVSFLNNVGLAESHWSFAGYKGGSEPGVISMTYLLESKAGNRACLSMSWNNSSEPVAEYLFFDVVKKTLKFAESVIP